MVVPDNLETGVDKVEWYTPVINKTYHEMAEHYGTEVHHLENENIYKQTLYRDLQ